MTRSIATFLTLLTLIAGCATAPPAAPPAVQPPVAAQRPTVLTQHGHQRTDEYYWLRERENPEVIAYLNAENAYLEETMKHTEPLQEKLYQEIVSRIPQRDESVPTLYACARSLVHPGETHVGRATLVPVDDDPEVDVAHLQRVLWDRGCRRILVEGGGVTVSKYLKANLLDRLQVAVAPFIIGDGER